MKTEIIEYECDGLKFKGYVAYNPEKKTPQPGVLIAHTWMGMNGFCKTQAHRLAELGYVGFAADIYGQGRTVETSEEALKLMLPLFMDRTLLRKRIHAAYDALKEHPRVDAKNIGAIGFCFGGLIVIELLRSGADLKGVVSFHGLLGYSLQEHHAQVIPHAKNVSGALLILHGYKDPLVTQEDIQNVQKEFSQAGVDWQMNIYGQASHAFTNPEAHDEKAGMVYNAHAEKRSWLAMCNFFQEVFSNNASQTA